MSLDQPLWDRWSLVHTTSGALFTIGFWAAGLRWFSVLVVFGIEVIWEFIENNSPGIWLWKQAGYNYNGDTLAHTIVDIIITTSGSAAAGLILELAGFAIGSAIVGAFALAMLLIFFFYVYKQRNTANTNKAVELGGLIF